MKKRFRWRKSISLLTAVFLFLCGCGKKSAKNMPSFTTPAVIKWGIVKYNPNIKSINESSEVLNYIKQKFNCRVEFEYYDSFNTKILTHMIKNEICPDILTVETMSAEGKFLAVNGLVVPASELIGDSLSFIPQETQDVLSESDGILYGIPGRYATKEQLSESMLSFAEGVYVAQPYYDLLNRPDIRTVNDIISVSKLFLSRYDDLRKAANVPSLACDSDLEAIPIVLGNSGSGVETLKHLFGIYPVFEQDGTVKLSISSPEWSRLASWLNNISDLSLKSMLLSGRMLNTALCGRSLFYIGSCSCINNINFESQDFNWERISLNDAKNVYPTNPYGSCQTYVFRNQNRQKVMNDLLSFLLSEDGNHLVKYGIKNKHWIPTGNTVLQLSWVNDRMKTEGGKFLSDTGIGQFLFLTTLKNDNPLCPDVLSTERNAFFTAVLNFTSSSNDTIKLEKLAAYELDLCQRAASLDIEHYPQKNSVIQSDILHFPLHEEQYAISLLQERYNFWKAQNLKGTVS